MMVSVETYLRRGERQLRQWALEPRVQQAGKVLAYGGSGFLLSAASLGNSPQPLAMGLCCAVTGWRAAVTAAGSLLGYRVFWGSAGSQGMVWAAMGGLLALLAGKQREVRDNPLLLPAMAAFLAAAAGLVFQIAWGDDTAFSLYGLRIAVAAGSTLLFSRWFHRRDAVTGWLTVAAAVLALAQVAPLPWLGLGYIACGALAVGGAFPAAVLGGLGLDLAQVTPVPMAAVLCIAYFLRLIPFSVKWIRCLAPASACLGVMALCSLWDAAPLPGLLLGGTLGVLLPGQTALHHRRGETGPAQVRLELAAGVLAQTQSMLLETQMPPIDEEALLKKVRSRACGVCSARNSCREQEKLSVDYLRQSLDFPCRKPGLILGELRRGREQLCVLRADRQRQREYRAALVQQYQFLADFLRELGDQLPRRGMQPGIRFRVQVSARSLGKQSANGDRCAAFPGPACKYYVLLCDGMGTGLGAAREGQSAGELLRQMLTAGFPAEHAFRSLNSLLALRSRAGAVTLDLAELRLDTGRAALYKWGAAPSLLLSRRGTEKVGTATPPPGISVEGSRETVVRLSLHRGETLILLSDGAEIGEALRHRTLSPDAPPGDLADAILARSTGEDDATAAVIRLVPVS